MSIEDLRAGLDGFDSGCSHVHTDITLKLHSGFIEQLGHPIYCELPECSSQLRVIRAATSHFPVLRTFTRLIYKAHMTILAIDSALSCGNIDELVPFLGLKATFSDLFSEDGVEHAVVNEDHFSSGLGCIERDLKVTHADLIAELQSRVNFSLDKYETDAWQRTKALYLQNGVPEQLLYICQYCQPFLNKNTIPARCVLNGLVTEPTPQELKSLNALCKQLTPCQIEIIHKVYPPVIQVLNSCVYMLRIHLLYNLCIRSKYTCYPLRRIMRVTLDVEQAFQSTYACYTPRCGLCAYTFRITTAFNLDKLCIS